MKALIVLTLFCLAPTTFASNSSFQEKAQNKLADKANSISGGNKFISTLEDPSLAKAESEGKCIDFLNSLPVHQLKGKVFIAESSYDVRGQKYRISSPNPHPSDRFRIVAQDVTSMLRGRDVSYEITGCNVTCEQERINFSTYRNKCESTIKLSLLEVGPKTDSIGGIYCNIFHLRERKSGSCSSHMYFAPY